MRQVFKATHILNNIGLEAATEFIETFLETKDKQLRDFLATHLIKIKVLDSNLQNHWMLGRLIQSCETEMLNDIKIKKFQSYRVKDYLAMDDTEKTNIATIFFFTQHGKSAFIKYLFKDFKY